MSVLRGEELLRNRAVTVGKFGIYAIVTCDTGDDAIHVWDFLEALGEVDHLSVRYELIDGLTLEWSVNRQGDFEAVTEFGDYLVCPDRWFPPGVDDGRKCDSIEHGKEMALDHYKSCVRRIFDKGE